jgi:hypothetical protein
VPLDDGCDSCAGSSESGHAAGQRTWGASATLSRLRRHRSRGRSSSAAGSAASAAAGRCPPSPDIRDTDGRPTSVEPEPTDLRVFVCT